MLESLSQGLSQLIDSIALSMLEDFLYNAPKKTISAPKDCFEIRVIDESDSVTFVIFDRDATILLSKSCANMFETYQKRGLAGTFPKEITNLVDKSFLFKVKVKSGYNSRQKGKTNGVGMDVEPMHSQSLEMHLPPKSLKKRIKVEKI
ncbi:hypothetical protein glysoja_038770 [Glycine soja]|uniref:Replication factor A C-terminal domain-containing protein n=1 Tax=Glycine soja TaxID=3848 RepID=A0A0B2RVR7_GLYSO|nr:hypothetical protein glysoja_038770 [Glycine soja]